MEENVQQQPIQNEAPSRQSDLQPEIKASSGGKLKWILLGILLVLIIVGVSYAALGKTNLFSQYFQKPTPTPAPATPTPTPDPIANWRTYTNKEYGFEIKYPENYKISSDTKTDVAPAIVADSYAQITFRDLTGHYYSQEEIEKEKENQELVQIGPLKAYKSPLGGNMDEGIDMGVTFYDFPKKGSILAILFSTQKPGEDDEIKIFNQILSTFKFINQDQAVDTSDWKTYLNSGEGFSFKYPQSLWINDHTVAGSVKKNTSPSISFGFFNINTVSLADGACGGISSSKLKEQRQLFDKAKVGENFDIGFGITDNNVKYSEITVNDFGVKYAYGISLCQGMVQENDPGSLDFIAIIFNKDIRISYYFPMDKSLLMGETARDMNQVADKISKSNYKGEAQGYYIDLQNILSTFKFTD